MYAATYRLYHKLCEISTVDVVSHMSHNTIYLNFYLINLQKKDLDV